MISRGDPRAILLVDTFTEVWRIEDFSKIPSTNGELYSTDYFTLDNDATMIAFTLDMYAGGDKPENNQFMSVYLHGREEEEEEEEEEDEDESLWKSVSIRFTVVLLTSSAEELCRRTMICALEAGGDYGWPRFIEREFLLSQIPDGILDVHFEVDYLLTVVRDITKKSMHVSESSYNRDSTDDFLSAFYEDEYRNVTIRVGERELPAHKFVLASRSNVFAAMFEHCVEEGPIMTITITDFDFEIVARMLCYMYRWRVPNMDVAYALELLRAADKYNMDDLKRFCSKFLLKNMDGENIGKILVAADVHQATELRKAAVDLLCKNLSEHFHKHRSLLQQRPELLCEIISRIGEIHKPPNYYP